MKRNNSSEDFDRSSFSREVCFLVLLSEPQVNHEPITKCHLNDYILTNVAV